jgi:hypothetical protein
MSESSEETKRKLTNTERSARSQEKKKRETEQEDKEMADKIKIWK